MIKHKIHFNVLIKLSLLALLVFILPACAQTVTSKAVGGDTLEITIKFNGLLNTTKYNYFLIFSNSETILMPKTGQYFVAPGQIYDEDKVSLLSPDDKLNFFYKNYFYTWSDYIIYSNSNFYLYNSGSNFSKTTSENTHYNYVNNNNFTYANQSNSNTVILQFSLAKLSGVSSRFYFSLATSLKGSDSLIDILDFGPEIRIDATPLEGTDTLDNANYPGADILNWKVRIF